MNPDSIKLFEMQNCNTLKNIIFIVIFLHVYFEYPKCNLILILLDISDKERYDTTIGIPTNLPEGNYILQTARLVGNDKSPYYSCARLHISGGKTHKNCKSSSMVTYDCHKSKGGIELVDSVIHKGRYYSFTASIYSVT